MTSFSLSLFLLGVGVKFCLETISGIWSELQHKEKKRGTVLVPKRGPTRNT